MLPDAGALKIARINTNHDTIDFVSDFCFLFALEASKLLLIRDGSQGQIMFLLASALP